MLDTTQRTPIFVDAAGRRVRWVRALLWAAVAIAVVYVLLAVSALLGGPRIDAPFLPDPIVADAPASPQHVDAPAAVSSTRASDPPAVAERSTPADTPTPVEPAASVEPAAPAPSPSSPAAEPTQPPATTAPGRSGDAGAGASDTNPGSVHRADPTGAPIRP